MSVLNEIKNLLGVDSLNFSERGTVLEISSSLPVGLLPSEEAIAAIISLAPSRDSVKLTILVDDGDIITFSNNGATHSQEYTDLIANSDNETQIEIRIEISKHIESNVFSIYSFDTFASNLLENNALDILSFFAYCLSGREYLIFEILEGDYFFTTETLAFVSKKQFEFTRSFQRLNRLQLCNETANFYNKSLYELIPEDFFITVNFESNPFSEQFNVFCSALSLVYLASSAIMHIAVLSSHQRGGE